MTKLTCSPAQIQHVCQRITNGHMKITVCFYDFYEHPVRSLFAQNCDITVSNIQLASHETFFTRGGTISLAVRFMIMRFKTRYHICVDSTPAESTPFFLELKRGVGRLYYYHATPRKGVDHTLPISAFSMPGKKNPPSWRIIPLRSVSF